MLPVEDVFFDRVVEKCGFLHHQSHALAKLTDIVLFNVNAVDENISKVSIIEPHQKINEGTFALTRLTNDRDAVFWINLQVKTFKYPLLWS